MTIKEMKEILVSEFNIPKISNAAIVSKKLGFKSPTFLYQAKYRGEIPCFDGTFFIDDLAEFFVKHPRYLTKKEHDNV